MAMLEVKDIEVFYGVIQAIKGISFEVLSAEEGSGGGLLRCIRCRRLNLSFGLIFSRR